MRPYVRVGWFGFVVWLFVLASIAALIAAAALYLIAILVAGMLVAVIVKAMDWFVHLAWGRVLWLVGRKHGGYWHGLTLRSSDALGETAPRADAVGRMFVGEGCSSAESALMRSAPYL